MAFALDALVGIQFGISDHSIVVGSLGSAGCLAVVLAFASITDAIQTSARPVFKDFHVPVGARWPVHHGQLQLAGQAGRTESQAAVPGARSYAPALPVAMRLQMPVTIPARYRITSAQEYPAHGAVHRVGADALQGLLAQTIHGTSQRCQISGVGLSHGSRLAGKVRARRILAGRRTPSAPADKSLGQRQIRQGPSGDKSSASPSGSSPASSDTSAAASSTIGAAAIIRCSRAASSASVMSLSVS